MSDWVDTNVQLLRREYPALEHVVADEVNWIRIPSHPLPIGIWQQSEVEIAFRIPVSAGEAPYGFWAHPQLELAQGSTISNYTYPATTPWGPDWGQFSFSPSESWQPKADIRLGPNMVRYARGIAERLAEGT